MDSATVPAPRLAPVLHYVIARTVGADFGAVKINKAVVAADREFFRRFGRTITGAASFQKQQHGPVPNGVLKALKALSVAGSVSKRSVMTPVGTRDEYLAHKEPDISAFTAEEVDVMNMAIASLERVTARQASEQTHDSLWEEVEMAGQIPVKAAAFSPSQVDEDTLAWALS